MSNYSMKNDVPPDRHSKNNLIAVENGHQASFPSISYAPNSSEFCSSPIQYNHQQPISGEANSAPLLENEKRPSWIRAIDSTHCSICKLEFSLTKRRHHCRACGKVLCNECSTSKLRLPELGYTDKVRVCHFDLLSQFLINTLFSPPFVVLVLFFFSYKLNAFFVSNLLLYGSITGKNFNLLLCMQDNCFVTRSSSEAFSLLEDMDVKDRINMSLKKDLSEKLQTIENFRSFLLELEGTIVGGNMPLESANSFNDLMQGCGTAVKKLVAKITVTKEALSKLEKSEADLTKAQRLKDQQISSLTTSLQQQVEQTEKMRFALAEKDTLAERLIEEEKARVNLQKKYQDVQSRCHNLETEIKKRNISLKVAYQDRSFSIHDQAMPLTTNIERNNSSRIVSGGFEEFQQEGESRSPFVCCCIPFRRRR
ncbi:FYVE zinc finger domain-containing protein [Cardiosporidium cionae]|uniref:FYVE zinc finger domain-containing protein n=1 Tax=Cardiosporidium cionae TaxID=476202 RepID=A0ABQ7JD36_9APIC|nr:FYVE zinc finger domain-containing protein [Cardiosporidium cionae]|eukprot:KAF8821908.1 FYVE zinc finger domain-containing protein [Cardiosporidium cionae]